MNLAGFFLFPLLGAALLVGAGVLGVVYFENNYADRVYPNVVVGGVNLGGMTVSEARLVLESAFPYANQPAFVFRDLGTNRTWTATPAQLGVSLDASSAVAAAFGIGRSHALQGNLLEQLDVYRNGRQLPLLWVVDAQPAVRFLASITADIYRPVVDAGLVFADNQLLATPSQIGRQLDAADALQQLSPLLLALGTGEVELLVLETHPRISDESVAGVLDTALKMTGRPITIFLAESAFESDPGPRNLTAEELAGMLVLWLDEGVTPPAYRVELDQEALAAWLEPLAESLSTESTDARFVFNDTTRLLEPIQPSIPSRSLNVAATVDTILVQVTGDNREVPLVIEWTQPRIGEDATGDDLGITELIAVGDSSFGGSSEVRIHNIATAASRFHGIVIPPGGEFSFNRYLGDVSEETGFEQGLIIFGGRTIQGVGGGVCQVSTTVFRAAFNAGFPIPERWPHGYRVGYYEQDIGPGMDATVFYPQVDFRFINNSPYHLLIETYVYRNTKKLEFKFYSTGDGRTVETPEPLVANVIPHPPDRYEENPELPTGKIEQVDWSADGADVLITRLVRRADGSILFEDRFFSHYLPWQAVYEYGPGTEGMPPPEVEPESDVTVDPDEDLESDTG